MRITANQKQAGTHIPTLLKVIPIIPGDVCEMGAGFNSTPLLHWLCQGRKLVTYEHDPEYVHYARKFQSYNHRVKHTTDFSDVDFNRHWGVVFIDHTSNRNANPHTRGDDLLKFTNADVFIMHDTEPENQKAYGYDKVFPKFKYRYDWTQCKPFTSVVSNTIDVTKWN